jgi:PAS domain S-box-containing protein
VGEADKVSALDGLTNRIGQFNQEVKPFFPVIIEGDRQLVLELANSSMSEMTTTSTAIIADLQGMVQEAQQDASAERAAAGRAADVTLWLLLGLSGVALATGVGTVVMLVGSVVGPLIALRASARAITSGRPQARAKVSGPEEVASLARDFNEMTDALAAKTEAVRESERRYRLLADNASDIIWTSDLNLRFTYQSPAVTRIRGYSPEEAMAQTPDQVMTPASLEVARKVLAEELAIENMEQKDLSRSRTLEVEQYCKDGSTIWTEVNMAFLRDEDGRAVGLLGASRQITERKLAEEALQESEIRYRLLAENASDHVWTMGPRRRYGNQKPGTRRCSQAPQRECSWLTCKRSNSAMPTQPCAGCLDTLKKSSCG